MMTEEQIENRVERKIDRLDRDYMSGLSCAAEYDAAMQAIRHWADEQYSILRAGGAI